MKYPSIYFRNVKGKRFKASFISWLGWCVELRLDPRVPLLDLERSSFHPVTQSTPPGAAPARGKAVGMLKCQVVSADAQCHLPQVVTDGTCQLSGGKTIQWQAGGQAVLRPWQPQSIPLQSPTAAPVVMFPSRPLMSLLGPQCPSLALLHPLCCWQHPAGPQELQFYRTMTMPGRHKIPPLAELSPPPAGQLSSPTHGSLFWAGFWYLSHRKCEKNCPRRTDFALANSSRMKLEAKRCLSLPVSLHPLPHAFYCWLFYFLSCSLLVVWDEMKDF